LLDIFGAIGVLIFGTALLVFSSDKAVKHSINIAQALKISPIIIGLTLVSIGTDFPEIANSIVSCAAGYGDINIGNSIGSVLAQITLVFGILSFIRTFKVKREEILIIGSCLILSLILLLATLEKGYISRLSAFFLVISWPLFMLVVRSSEKFLKESKKFRVYAKKRSNNFLLDILIATLGFAGVGIGSYLVVQSVIKLSIAFKVPEFLLSFFIVAIGTSLPELTVDFTAIRKKAYGIAVGDLIGSCIVDATLAPAIGLLLFPVPIHPVSLNIGFYTLFASFLVILILAIREKVDKLAGILFILLYLISYAVIA